MENLILNNRSILDFESNVPLDTIERPLWWQERGLSYPATGYGKRIPTRHMVRYQGKWHRVYCAIFSNVGTCYIGKLSDQLYIS